MGRCLGKTLRRAPVSIPSNIAEGQARYYQKEFHHFLSHARGSLAELESQTIISQNLGYLSQDHAERLLERTAELGRVLNGLIASIKPAKQPHSENRGLSAENRNSSAMPDVHHVAILSYVVFSFEAQRALGARVGFRAGFE